MTTLNWSGQTWTIRVASTGTAPGPNAWGASTPQDYSVDGGGNLLLNVYFDGSFWRCVELDGNTALGYGQYTWVINTCPIGWDINYVLGLFTYDSTDDGTHFFREIDIELAQWGVVQASRFWYTNQPGTDSNQTGDHPSSFAAPYTATFIWQAGQIYWKVTDTHGLILGEHVCTNDVQAPNGASGPMPIMNLWLQGATGPGGNGAPANGQSLSVSLASFSFTPSVTHSLVAAASTAVSFPSAVYVSG